MTKRRFFPGKWPLGTIIEVEWVDHCGRGGWAKPESYRQETCDPCRSVGYLLREDEHEIVLIQSMAHSTGNVNDSIIIDKRTVSSRRVIGKSKGKQ